jgi:hypothetical protein
MPDGAGRDPLRTAAVLGMAALLLVGTLPLMVRAPLAHTLIPLLALTPMLLLLAMVSFTLTPVQSPFLLVIPST